MVYNTIIYSKEVENVGIYKILTMHLFCLKFLSLENMPCPEAAGQELALTFLIILLPLKRDALCMK